MENQKFDSRAGCLDYGNSYEFLMAAFYGLCLSLNEKVSDFKMSTNNTDMGKFDDVVLEIKYKNGDRYLYALQLKHSASKNNIKQDAFGSADGDFSLIKYNHGYKETEEICKTKSYKIPFENFYFILYTNKLLPKFHTHVNGQKIDSDELTLKSSNITVYKYDKCVAQDLINLSEASTHFIYKFRKDENTSNKKGKSKQKIQLDDNFLNQFVLYTQQKDAQEIECLISKTILALFNCDTNVVINYINFFKFWWRGDFGKFKLTKRDIMLKLTEYVLTPHIPDVNFRKLKHYGDNSDLLKRCFENFDLTVVEDSEEAEAIIWGTILNEPFPKLENFDTWSQPFPKYFLEKTQGPISAQGENFIEPSLKKSYINLWHEDRVPLFVKVSEKFRKGIYGAIKLCEHDQKKKKFVLMDGNFDGDEFTEDIEIFQNLEHLEAKCEDLYQIVCTKVTVSLQGRQFIKLGQLVGWDCGRSVPVKEFLLMLDNNFIIGDDCRKFLPKHYVSRLVPKVLLDLVALEEIESEIFVVSCQGFEKISFKCNTCEINKYLVMKHNGSQFSDKTLILVDKICSGSQFAEVCLLNSGQICHHVKIVAKNKIEWIETRGSINSLRQYQVDHRNYNPNDFIEDVKSLEYFRHRINLICAAPGMGKSVMLKYLEYNCSSDHWVISVNLNDHIKFFKQEHTLPQVLEYLLENQYNFLKEIINGFSSRKQILILWDSFDEIPSNCINPVVSTIKCLFSEGYCQWISARSYSKEFLENTFNIFSLTVTEFSQKDQQEYIYNNLKEKFDDEEKAQEMVSILNENMSSSLNCGYFDYSGVPLQIYMVMEIFLKDPKKYLEKFKIVILTDIYQEFIDGKFNDLFARASTNRDNHRWQKIQKKFKNTQLSQYEIAALRASFDETVFTCLNLDCSGFLGKIVENRDNLGLIFGLNDEMKPIFTHKTYEEYLTASWLVKNCGNYQNLIQMIFKEEYRNIRLMFDMILAKDSPVHVAVLYRNLDVLEKYQNEIPNRKDRGGRNSLQIACSWGMKHPLVDTIEEENKTVISIKKTSDHPDENIEIVKFLLLHKCNPFEKDQLTGWNAIEYSDQTLSLSSLEAISKYHQIVLDELSNFNDSNTLLYYCIKFNYKNLFSLLKNYHYIELVLDDEEPRTLLHFAVFMDRQDFVAKLLTFPKYQKVIDRPYKDLGSPLFNAGFSGNVEMFKLLREKNGKSGRNELSPLIGAVAFGHYKFCQLLLEEEKMDPNALNMDGNSVLQIAAMKNNIDIMKLLLDKGSEVNYINYMDLAAVDYCVDNESVEGVRLLLENGAEINRQGFTLYGYTPLHNACEKSSPEVIKLLLEAGADPTIKSNRQYTPLHVALINKQEAIAKILIEADSRVINEYSEEKSTPTMLATLENFHDTVELLAKLGADLDSNQGKDSPLRIATLKEFEKSVEILLKYGASPNRPDIHGFTPLFYAIKNEAIMKLFLGDSATDVDARGKSGESALHFAAQNGKVRAVEELIDHGAIVDARDFNMETPLHHAIKAKHNDAVECLLKYKAKTDDGIHLLGLACMNDAPDCLLTLINHGIDFNLRDNQGRSALHFASVKSLFCVKLLAVKSTDVNICDKHGLSPLCLATVMGKIEIMDELVKNGAKITDGFGSSTLLHLSCATGDIATSIFLINKGCDIDAQDENGRTPLHCSVEQMTSSFIFEIVAFLKQFKIQVPFERNYKECAKELLDRGARVDIKHNSGLTPLVSAAACNNLEIVKLFFQKFGTRDDLDDEWQKCFLVAAARSLEILQFLHEHKLAEINSKEDTNGMTALHYACFANANDCVVYLVKNGAGIDVEAANGCTPLYFCSIKGNYTLVKFLVENQAKIDVFNGHGNTSLFGAAAEGFLDIVIFLDENGADINVLDVEGDSPLHDAAARGHVEVVKYLISRNAKVLRKNIYGKAPVDLAKENGRDEIVKILEMCMKEQ